MTISTIADRKIIPACETEVAGGVDYRDFMELALHYRHRIIGAGVIDDNRSECAICLRLEGCYGTGKKSPGVEVYDDDHDVRGLVLIGIPSRNRRILLHQVQRHRAAGARVMPQCIRATANHTRFIQLI